MVAREQATTALAVFVATFLLSAAGPFPTISPFSPLLHAPYIPPLFPPLHADGL